MERLQFAGDHYRPSSQNWPTARQAMTCERLRPARQHRETGFDLVDSDRLLPLIHLGPKRDHEHVDRNHFRHVAKKACQIGEGAWGRRGTCPRIMGLANLDTELEQFVLNARRGRPGEARPTDRVVFRRPSLGHRGQRGRESWVGQKAFAMPF